MAVQFNLVADVTVLLFLEDIELYLLVPKIM